MVGPALWAGVPFDPDTGTVNPSSDAISRPPRNTTGELDREAFLMLLVTQMQHQDPLNPMDDRDFLAQMAQFSALEQQQHMTRSMELQQAYSMIGKNVLAHFVCDTSNQLMEANGPVVHVRRVNSQIFLGVVTETPTFNNYGQMITNEAGNPVTEIRVVEVPLDRVNLVEDEHMMHLQLQGILNGVANARDIGLIGRYIQAFTFDEDGEPSGFIEGQVEFVRFLGQRSVLMVNGHEVFDDEILSISDGPLVLGQTIRGRCWAQSGNGFVEVEGEIRGINVSNGRAFVNVDGTNLRLNRVDHLITGLRFVGNLVHHPTDIAGTVDAVGVRNGYVYIYINGERRDLMEYLEGGGRQVRNLPSPPATSPEDPDDDSSDD